MANRLFCTFPTIDTNDTYKVYIDDASYGGSPVEIDLAADGFTLRYDGDTKDQFNGVIGSRLTLTIAVTSTTQTAIQSFANDLKTASETRFTIKVDHNNGSIDRLFWCGYVLQDLSGFDDVGPTYGFTVSATDGIGRLKGQDYKQNDTTPVGLKTVLEHMLECLTKDTLSTLYYGGSDDFIATSVNWQDSRIGSPSAGKCPTAYTRFAGKIFAKKENSNSNAYTFATAFEVLETIASHWAARLYFSEGVYRLEQINERSQDSYYERRFNKTGGLTTSTAAKTSDFVIDRVTKDRLSGGVFGYIPALKSVTAIYQHDAGGNLLEGYGNRWHNGSDTPSNLTFDNLVLGGDDFLRVSGKLNCNIYLGQPYTQEWRFKWGLRIAVGGTTLDANSLQVWVGGNPTTTINPTTPIWNGTTEYYELSTTFAIGDSINEVITFAFDTPTLPAGTTIDVDFVEIGGTDLFGNAVTIQDNWWSIENPSLQILDNIDPDTYFEKKRRYRVDNSTVGNSDTLTQEFAFGHAVTGATESKLETFNGSLWDITTATWDYGARTDNYEFAKLWANEVMAARTKPTPVWSGEIRAKAMRAQDRLIFQADNTAWLMLRGEFRARENVWSGEWFEAGVNRNGTTQGPTIKLGNGRTIPQPNGAFTPGVFSPATGSPSFFGPANVALTALTTNIVSTTIPAGTVTSIPLRYPVKANSYLANDDIFVVNSTTGEVVGFTVSTTANAGDTSLTVVPTTTTKAIPLGAQILYGPLNKYTGQGGDGMNLPAGTAGRILRHDGTSWVPYAGSTDGHVLTWDTTNGWQAEAVSGGGGGTVTSVGLTMPAIFTVSGSPVTSSGTITASLNTQQPNYVWAGPDVGPTPAAPGFRALVSDDIPNLAASKITSGVFPIARGGTGLSSLGSAGNLIRVDTAGTGLEYFAPAYLTTNQTITLSGDVGGSGSTAISTTIANNAVTDAKLRQGTALSVIGRSANSVGNVADIAASVDGQVLRRSGTTLAFGTIATAGIADDAVTYAKIQNVTDNRLLGRSAGSAGDVQEITVGSGLSLSGGTLSATGGGVTGTGVSGRLAIWNGTSSITSDDFPLIFDTTNNRMGIGAPTPSAYLHIGVPTGTLDEGIRVSGNVSGNINNLLLNVNNVNAGSNSILTIGTGGASGGDPILQLNVNAVTTWSVGLDNSDNDRFKISHSTAPGSNDRLSITTAGNVSIGTTSTTARLNVDGSGATSSTYGLQIRNSGGSHVICARDDQRVGILTTSPTQELHVQGDVIARQYQNLSGETINVTYGTGAGTGPLTVLLGGGANFFRFHFTTGTSPVANGDIFTITCPQPWNSVPVVVFSPNNAQTATDISKFYVSTLTSTTFIIKANGTLSASTTYAFNFIVGGF